MVFTDYKKLFPQKKLKLNFIKYHLNKLFQKLLNQFPRLILSESETTPPVGAVPPESPPVLVLVDVLVEVDVLVSPPVLVDVLVRAERSRRDG